MNENEWCDYHNASSLGQTKSLDLLMSCHRGGHKFDIITNSGDLLENVSIDDLGSKLKFIYNVNDNIESYPPNGIRKWRVCPVKTKVSSKKGYLVLNRDKTAGFYTTDYQLAYEVRKGSETNCFDANGVFSKEAVKFVELWSDDECSLVEINL